MLSAPLLGWRERPTARGDAVPVDPPGSAALDQVSRHYGLALSPADVASFEPVVDGLLASWDAVERLYSETAPHAPDRPWKRPAETDNPLGAWYVTTSITEREDGPLAGRLGRDQGQHGRRRGSDDERIIDRGGLRARPRRHGREQAAGRRGDHRRQGGLRGPVLLRRIAHLADRAGAQPVGHHAVGGRFVQRQRRPARQPGRSISPPAATRADRSGSRPRTAEWSGTSRPTGWFPTPGLSRSSRRSTTWGRWPAPSPTWR